MGWAEGHIERLKRRQRITIKPRGNSMEPTIRSGDEVVVERLLPDAELKKGDVVLCSVRNREYLHFVRGISVLSVLIGNALGHMNGWTPRSKVYGRVVEVRPKGLGADLAPSVKK